MLSTALGPEGNEERLPALVRGSLYQRSAHVIRYVAGLSLPATAWPRQTRLATRPALHGLALHGQDGEIRVRAYESRPLLALVRGRSQFVVSYRRT